MRLADDPIGSTHQLTEAAHIEAGSSASVTVVTGDTIVERTGVVPTVVKIDVEGYELEVLKGMRHVLTELSLRAIFCEIHFALLEERGQPFAPIEIERILNEAGFDVRYTDSSHIQAVRETGFDRSHINGITTKQRVGAAP